MLHIDFPIGPADAESLTGVGLSLVAGIAVIALYEALVWWFNRRKR